MKTAFEPQETFYEMKKIQILNSSRILLNLNPQVKHYLNDFCRHVLNSIHEHCQSEKKNILVNIFEYMANPLIRFHNLRE